jgi:hypothetical protein
MELVLLHIGANDAGDLRNYTDTSYFSKCLMHALRRMRAGQVIEAGTTNFTTTQGAGGSNWSTNSSSPTVKSGGSTQLASAVGNVFTVTLPSTFQGGSIYLTGIVVNGSGAAFSITVDGSANGTWDTTGLAINAGVSYPTVYEVAGLSAGAHTIVGTCTSITGGTHVDCALIPAVNPPLIVLLQYMNAPTLPPGGGTHTPITSGDVDTFNGYLQSAAAAFSDGLVKYCPISLDTAVAAYWSSDNQHPSDIGHELIEAQIYAFLKTTGYLTRTHVSKGVTAAAVMRPRFANLSDDTCVNQVTLVAGSAALSSRAVTANTRAILNRVGTNANAGFLSYVVTTPTTGSGAGTLTITSSNGSDTSVVDVFLYEAVTTV